MNKFLMTLTLAASTLATAITATAESAPPASFEGFKQIQTYEPLPGLKVYEYLHDASGLKVLVQPRVKTGVIAYVTAFNVGSRFEQAGHTGIAHLFEHMMFRGTPSFPEPFKTLSGWGDRFNAYTSFDLTLYHELVPREVFGDLVKFESERMRKLQLNETVFKTERGAVISERKMRTEDSPGGRLYWELSQAAFDQHPYATGPIGWQEDLDRTNYQDALNFYNRYYAPNRAVISIVGDVSVLEALKTLHKYYGGFKREEWTEPTVPVENVKRKNRRVVMPMQTESVYMADARFTSKLGDAQNAAEMLLCSLLADSKLGFLNFELVETKIARSVNDSCYYLVDPGLASIHVVGNPAVSLEKLERAYDKALKKFPAWMNAERLEGIKLFYLASHLGELREPMGLAENLASSAITSNDPVFGFKFMEQIRGVTLDQVKAVWANWQIRSKTRVILNPAKKSAPFKRKSVKA